MIVKFVLHLQNERVTPPSWIVFEPSLSRVRIFIVLKFAPDIRPAYM